MKNGFKTLSDVISEQGKDIEDVFETLAQEREMASEYGLNLPTLFGEVQNGNEKAGADVPPPDDQE